MTMSIENNRSLDPFRPPFSKLQEWLDNLLMHLDIGLSLLSELEQLRKNFWGHHQDHNHNQEEPPGSQEQAPPQGRSPDDGQHSGKANKDKGPNHLQDHLQDQYHTPESHLGQQHPKDSHVMRSDKNHVDKNPTCCRSDKTEPNQDNKQSHQPQEDVAQILHRPSNGLRTCSALWDRSTEDSSLL